MNRLLIRSLVDKTPLDMIYLSSNNEITQRKVIIKEISGSYVRAYCFLRRQTRLFKVENILSVMPRKVREQNIS